MTKKLFLAVVTFLVLSVGALFAAPFLIDKILPQETVSYPEYIKMDLVELATESDIIVLGTVKKVLPTVREKPVVVIGEKAAEEAEKRGVKRFTIVRDEKAAKEVEKEEKWIYTDKVVEVDEYIKNPQKQNVVIVREEGGEIDNKTWMIAGQKNLKVGDKVILFLSDFNGKYLIVGGPQGKYYIQEDKAINESGEDCRDINELISKIKSIY